MPRTPILTRQTEIREIREPVIPISTMENTLTKFEVLIDEIKARLEIEKQQENDICFNLFRSEIVMLVSAVDYYFYETVKTGLIEIYNGDRKRTDKSDNLKIPFKFVIAAVDNPESSEWFSEAIVDVFGTSPFQSIKQIRYIIQLLSNKVKSFNRALSKNLNKEINTIENDLKTIFQRRHQIAHNCDIPKDSDIPQEISYKFVIEKCDILLKYITSFNNNIKLV